MGIGNQITSSPIKIEVCTIPDPETWATDNVDFLDKITGRVDLGLFNGETLGVDFARELTEFLQGVPGELANVVLTRKKIDIAGELTEWTPGVLALTLVPNSVTGYNVTGTEGAKVVDASFFGTRETCGDQTFAILLSGETSDCRKWYFAGFRCFNMTASASLRSTGGNPSPIPAMFTLAPAENEPNKTRNLGCFWIEN